MRSNTERTQELSARLDGDWFDTVIGATRETISDDVGLTLHILDVEVEVGNDILPTRLTTGQEWLSFEMLKRLVIRTNDELDTVQVVTPGTERGDDGEQLLLVHGVPSLSRQHLLG